MGFYQKISKRSKKTTPDQEYEVVTCDEFNDGVFRKYNMSPKIKKSSQIIMEIKGGVDYRTSEKTIVKIGTRDGKEYIYSVQNETGIDNLLSLPTY